MISGKVFHHKDPIPNSAIYIKYGATEFPGADVTTYDNSIVADANGYFEFKDLRKGSYFLYGAGYDVAISSIVKGGVGIKLKNKETLNTNVPVTED